MSQYPCSSCGQRTKGRLATLYNAWFNDEGTRECYRQRLCASCITTLADILRASASESSLDVACCLGCGKDASAELSPIYLTVFLPKQEQREYALTMCLSCATSLRSTLMVGAQLMQDRGGNGGGLVSAEWEAIGL